MAESLFIPENGTKTEIFEAILPQISVLTQYETSRTAALANVTAILKTAFDHFWVGFYLLEGSQTKLTLNVFQGPIACSRIALGKGVCGTAWSKCQTIVVDDVDSFDGHIACSSLSKSEIVIPIIKNSQVVGVLDIDSTQLAKFDTVDAEYYQKICEIIASNCF